MWGLSLSITKEESQRITKNIYIIILEKKIFNYQTDDSGKNLNFEIYLVFVLKNKLPLNMD